MRKSDFAVRLGSWLGEGLHAGWVVWSLFVVFTFVKTLIFNYYAFHYRFETFDTCRQVAGGVIIKLAFAVLLASVVFLLRDKRWMILLSFVVDTWIVANLVYMRNNYIMLDAEAFNQSANLHGYSASILIYIEWATDLMFYLMTALMSCVFFFTAKTERSWRMWLLTTVAGVVLYLAGDALNGGWGKNTISREGREQVYGTNFSATVRRTSVLEAPLFIVSDYVKMIRGIMPRHPLTEADAECLESLTDSEREYTNDSPLIIVLLESLENWVVREDVMPNLWRLSRSEHVLYADSVHTQIVGAPSADGQMLVNTGLLPIDAGATCLHFPGNEYPSLMKLTSEHTVCLLPHDPAVWNQSGMSVAYGYDTTIVFSDIDTLLFARLNDLVDQGERHIQCITQSTHAPFVNEKYSRLDLPGSMPWVMYNYIRGFNALDDGLGLFIRKLETDERMRDYTVVFTGDHRILHKEMRQTMMSYTRKHGLDYKAYDDCLPLIIYSPRIEGNLYVHREAYQMDIYPTVLSLLGAKDYYWRGFGVDLSDSRAERSVSADEAARLSDRVIRNNYFQR